MFDHAATNGTETLVEDGKLAALGRLAPGVAHEINNPLFAILGFAEFLLAEAEPGTKAHERLTLVRDSGLEIKEVVRALVEFAREPSDAFAAVSLADVVRSTVALVRRTTPGAGPEVVERYGGGDTTVWGSPNELKQALLHEIARAQAVAGEAGVVVVELEAEPGSAVVTISPGGGDASFRGASLAARATAEIARAHGGELVSSADATALRIPLAAGAGQENAPEAA